MLLEKKSLLLALILTIIQFNSNASDELPDDYKTFITLVGMLKNVSNSIDRLKDNNPAMVIASIGSPRISGVDTGEGLTSHGLVLVVDNVRGKNLPTAVLTPWGKVPLVRSNNNLTPEAADLIVKNLLDGYNYKSFEPEGLPAAYSQSRLYSILGPKNSVIELPAPYSVQARLRYGDEYREIALDWHRLLDYWRDIDPYTYAALVDHGFLRVDSH